jgi:hypothetical protein
MNTWKIPKFNIRRESSFWPGSKIWKHECGCVLKSEHPTTYPPPKCSGCGHVTSRVTVKWNRYGGTCGGRNTAFGWRRIK